MQKTKLSRRSRIVIVLLSVSCAVALIAFLFMLHGYRGWIRYYEREETYHAHYETYVQIGDYHSLVRNFENDYGLIRTLDKNRPEYYALCRYAEDAYYYKILSDCGETAAAEKVLLRMREEAGQLGPLSAHIPLISERLQINPQVNE